jgi:hypothetical protein
MRRGPLFSVLGPAIYLVVAAELCACGAPEERAGTASQALDSYSFKRRAEPLLPDAPKPNDEFGMAVALSLRWAVVGSTGADFEPSAADEDKYDNTGSATVFERKHGNWNRAATLKPPESWPDAEFGTTVVATDDLIVVGAPLADPSGNGSLFGSGLVVSFKHDGQNWQQEPVLHGLGEAEERLFGAALAMDGRTLLVGAYGTDQVFSHTRSAQGWSEPVAIASPAPAGSGFGYSVALHDPWAFVGAPFDGGAGGAQSEAQGAVYVFHRDGDAWTPQGALERYAFGSNDLFGAALAAQNGLVVATEYGNQSAVAFRLDAGAWANPFRVISGSAAGDSAFGWSAALGVGDTIWVGAFREDTWDGAVFPFLRDGALWRPDDRITFGGDGRFGYSVASAPGALLVGAPDTGTAKQGAVYVIEISDGSTCQKDADCFSGHCVDEVCCDSACEGACLSCLAAEKQDDSPDGVCGPKRPSAPPAHGACPDLGPQSCDTNGRCDGAGNCAKYPVGTQCGEPFCSGQDLVGAALCDEQGRCEAPAAAACSKSYTCEDSSCPSGCTSDADCRDDFYCDDGRCRPQAGLGAPCASAEACLSGQCADGVCCNQACDGQCEACDEPGSAGSCRALEPGASPRPSRKPCDGGDGDVCAALFCDGQERSSCTQLAEAGTVCGEPSCRDGHELAAGQCDGAGQCRTDVTKSCGAYACGRADTTRGRPAQCLARCEMVDDCAPDFYCTMDHECKPIPDSSVESQGCALSGNLPAESGWGYLASLGGLLALLGLRRRGP